MPESFTEKMAQRILGGETDESDKTKSRQPLFFFNIPKQEFYSPRQVANVLLFSDQTLWRWLRQGRLPAIRYGRYYRISFETLAELIKNGNSLIRQNLINQATFGLPKNPK